jgi:hypothetical protein
MNAVILREFGWQVEFGILTNPEMNAEDRMIAVRP